MKRRPDGYYIENINPYHKIMPHIMPHRSDAMNMTFVDIDCEPIDAFIKEMADKGVTYSYIDILLAAMTRLFARRPAINRFVMNKKIYQHNDITISFVVKKKMVDNSEDTSVKLHFDGHEGIDEIKEKTDEVIKANTGEDIYNSVDKTAKILTSAPHWLISLAIGTINFLDKHNILPAKIIEVSPFHNSLFITFLKSIKGDALLHHCYNFGTTGIFIGVGKESYQPVVVKGQIVSKKILPLGVVMDERFCDGLYFVNSMRVLKKILSDPKCLIEEYHFKSEEAEAVGVRSKGEREKYKRLAKEHERKKKEAKKAAKQAKAEAKKTEKDN